MSTDLPVSQLGQYRLIEKLGQGGMATVYKAHQTNMDRIVAIKVLPPALRLDPDFVARFRQEAKIIASLEHARILPVHDYGEEGDFTYLVMRYLEGKNLHQRIKDEGPFSIEEAARVIRQVTEGLHYAHSKNIIHRDMSANNIMFDGSGDAYITDFGLAKMVAGSARLTGHSVVGTPAYVAPEQVMGDKPDPRTDIYALGVVLFEMLTGDVPFIGDTPMVIIFQHVNDPLPDPRSIREDLPDAVAEVVLKATEKNPDDRFASASEMANALGKAVRGLSSMMLSIKPDKSIMSSRVFVAGHTSKTGPAGASRRSTLKPQATVPGTAAPALAEKPDGTPGWLFPLLGLIVIGLVIGAAAIIANRMGVFGGGSATATPQTQIAANPTDAATAEVTEADSAETSAMDGATQAATEQETAQRTNTAGSTLTAAPTLTSSPTQAVVASATPQAPPPTPPGGGGPTPGGGGSAISLADAATLKCPVGEQPVFAVDFDAAQPEEMSAVMPESPTLTSLSGAALQIAASNPGPGGNVLLNTTTPPKSPHIMAKVAWQNGAGGFVIMSYFKPGSMDVYVLVIGDRGLQIKRGNSDLHVGSAPANLTDGTYHTVEFIIKNGSIQALVDGQSVATASDSTNPPPPGSVGLHADVTTASVDWVLVCDAGG